MKILQAHNFYQQAGGEDAVVAAERQLLEAHGHHVIPYVVHNNAIKGMSGSSAALLTIWNQQTIDQVLPLLTKHRPDVIHSHNTFPLISPALYRAAAEAAIPVVQTLHNYRLLCPAATFYRDGRICEDCLGKWPIDSVVHGCYRGSRPATAVTATMLTVHRVSGTWRDRVHTYIALSEFAKRKFIQGGIPAHKVTVKPNFLPRDPGLGTGLGGYVLFAGRLMEYKGVRTLLEAWRNMPANLPLKIAGDGPLMKDVREAAASLPNIEVLGTCNRERMMELAQDARVLVFPSEWYEGMPMSLLEAFACGTPAIVSDLESLDDFATEGINALRFRTGNPTSLAHTVQRCFADTELWMTLRRGARRTYSERFTAERNYPALMRIYEKSVPYFSVRKQRAAAG